MSGRPSTWVALPGGAYVDAWEAVAVVLQPTGASLVLRSGVHVHTSMTPEDALAELEKVRTRIRAWEARPSRERTPARKGRRGR